MTSRLADLAASGQGVWLDFVDRGFLAAGGLQKLIDEDGLTGVTSNPSIFEKAMGHGDAYDEGLRAFLDSGDARVVDINESLAIADIRVVADMLRPVYDRLDRRDGYVSLEVSPYLAQGTDDTIAEARRLWAAVDRPNLMIKVPGTAAGVPAIAALIADGININVTLLFSIDAYRAVADAYMTGLQARLAKGEPIDGVASVASFFVSRIDGAMDKATAALDGARKTEAEALSGRIAIANAKMAYAAYEEMIADGRWQALAAAGAMPQRLLWASTGTKNAGQSDVLYVDGLIGPETVNTIPPKTMDAFRDHGSVAPTLAAGRDEARAVIADADRLGLDLPGVTAALVVDGIQQFSDAADALLGAVADKRAAFLGDRMNAMTAALPEALDKAVAERLKLASREGWSRRLWKGDASLWTGGDEAKWRGWLDAASGAQVDLQALDALAAHAREYDDAVLLGMGGSSLGPEVLARMFGAADGHPRLHVLDTSDPGQIGTVAGAIDVARTLFVVSSKSGSTLEPDMLRAYFFDLVKAAVGAHAAGRQFVAITDPGSALDAAARNDNYAHILLGDPAIGGRYSVLSVFGMGPAAVIGVDVRRLFADTRAMLLGCGPDVPPGANPGVRLGVIMGEAVRAGRDKLTILMGAGPTGASLAPIGPWLEQLLAESTGKKGTGIVPIDGEPLGEPAVYGDDRLFVALQVAGERDGAFDAGLDALVAAGRPVVRIALASTDLIGQEFFRWEVATAIAGAVIGIDPFDQPDVEDAKIATRTLVDAYEKSGELEIGEPMAADADIALYAAGDAAAASGSVVEILGRHLGALRPGDYAGFLAYIERDAAHEAVLTRMRASVRNAAKVATVVGFGPRFLHSTGQAYKGGPKTGAFLVITADRADDLAVPNRKASFGTVQLSQALGDAEILATRGQRVLRVHLKRDASRGLERLAALVAEREHGR